MEAVVTKQVWTLVCCSYRPLHTYHPHCSFKEPVLWICIRRRLRVHAQMLPGTHAVLFLFLYSQILNILQTRLSVSAQDPFSLFLLDVPCAQHIQACVTVISVHDHSLLLTIQFSRKGLVSDLPLYFQQLLAHSSR